MKYGFDGLEKMVGFRVDPHLPKNWILFGSRPKRKPGKPVNDIVFDKVAMSTLLGMMKKGSKYRLPSYHISMSKAILQYLKG